MTTQLALKMLAALAVAAVVSFLTTPMVKSLAYKVGAIDVPKDNRRMHKTPIPRLGGLAIFIAFLLTVLIFADIDRPIRGILLGAVMIVVLGVLDDILTLKALPKLLVQIAAAAMAVYHGCVIQFFSNPNVFSDATYISLGWLSVPVTIIWIVAITNAVNFIDGLDGLAVGVSAISTAALVVIALLVQEINIAVILIALFGACLGFIPYNMNPAKIFMGDTGSLALGGAVAGLSILTRTEFLAVILGGLFLAEVMSDIIQIVSFKSTGRRVFRMAPLHHHFELGGWTEVNVVIRFWIIAGLCVIAGLGLFYAEYLRQLIFG